MTMNKGILFIAICLGILAGGSSGWAAPPLQYSQDAIQFDGLNSGNTLIGESCATGTYDACLQVTGGVQDLTSLIDKFIPEGEICCGSSDISVQIDNAGTSTVTVADNFYGSFAGSVNSSDTGSADTLNWASAVYGSPFSIDLTNADNIITDVVFNVGSSLTNTSEPSTNAPEPTSIALLFAALFGVAFVRGGSRTSHRQMS